MGQARVSGKLTTNQNLEEPAICGKVPGNQSLRVQGQVRDWVEVREVIWMTYFKDLLASSGSSCGQSQTENGVGCQLLVAPHGDA